MEESFREPSTQPTFSMPFSVQLSENYWREVSWMNGRITTETRTTKAATDHTDHREKSWVNERDLYGIRWAKRREEEIATERERKRESERERRERVVSGCWMFSVSESSFHISRPFFSSKFTSLNFFLQVLCLSSLRITRSTTFHQVTLFSLFSSSQLYLSIQRRFWTLRQLRRFSFLLMSRMSKINTSRDFSVCFPPSTWLDPEWSPDSSLSQDFSIHPQSVSFRWTRAVEFETEKIRNASCGRVD